VSFKTDAEKDHTLAECRAEYVDAGEDNARRIQECLNDLLVGSTGRFGSVAAAHIPSKSRSERLVCDHYQTLTAAKTDSD
jgi:hypothetical protein